MKDSQDRREFLRATCTIAGTMVIANFNSLRAGIPGSYSKPDEEKKVTLTEDLMREHGVLRRVQLIYNEISIRLEKGKGYPTQALQDSADIIHTFIENYHEKLEEDYLFPRFEKAGKMSDLVKVLRQQHQSGRKLTDLIKNRAGSKDRNTLVKAMADFVRMYSPHAAREDTILFPEFHNIVSENEFDSLGEEFEKKEKQLFGEDGFEKMVSKVEGIEKTLGIYDLSQFTPKI